MRQFSWRWAAKLFFLIAAIGVVILGCGGIAKSIRMAGAPLGYDGAQGLFGANAVSTVTLRRYHSKVPDEEVIEIAFTSNDDGNCTVPIYGMTGRLHMVTSWPDPSATPTAAWDLELVKDRPKVDAFQGSQLDLSLTTTSYIMNKETPCNGLYMLTAANMGATRTAHVEIIMLR